MMDLDLSRFNSAFVREHGSAEILMRLTTEQGGSRSYPCLQQVAINMD